MHMHRAHLIVFRKSRDVYGFLHKNSPDEFHHWTQTKFNKCTLLPDTRKSAQHQHAKQHLLHVQPALFVG